MADQYSIARRRGLNWCIIDRKGEIVRQRISTGAEARDLADEMNVKATKQTGSETFLSLGLSSPDDTGSAEHRAIYDLLVDCFDTGDHAYADDMGDPPADYARGMLEEVISWAQEMRREINVHERNAKRAAKA